MHVLSTYFKRKPEFTDINYIYWQ